MFGKVTKIIKFHKHRTNANGVSQVLADSIFIEYFAQVERDYLNTTINSIKLTNSSVVDGCEIKITCPKDIYLKIVSEFSKKFYGSICDLEC